MLNRLYDSPELSIRDYICRHRPAPGGEGPCRDPRATAAPSGEERSVRHEIVFPRTGLYVKHVGRERIVADLNQILFFTRGESYRVSHPLGGGDRCTTICVRDDLLLDLLSAFDPGAGADSGGPERPFPRTHAPCPPRAAFSHRRLLTDLSRPGRDEVGIQETVFDLLGQAIAATRARPAQDARPPRSVTRRSHREIALAAVTVMNDRFREPLTLRTIASAVGSSPYHLCRIFRREIGSSLHRYLNRLRLRASLEPLADGEPDLTDLALSIGFSDHSHFTNAFRGEFGLPPSRFRALATPARIRRMSRNLQA